MSARPYAAIAVAREGAALRITLNNPARKNAIGPAMVNELLWALEDAFAAIAESYAALRYADTSARPAEREALVATLARAVAALPPAASLRTLGA